MLVELRRSRERRAAPESRTAARRVALVVMPAHTPNHPSLAAATLAAELRLRGHEVDVHHLNVEAASAIGLSTYLTIGYEESWAHNVSEWLFSHPSITPGAADEKTMRGFLQARGLSAFARLDLARLRQSYDRLLEKWAGELPWSSYDVVGFTLMFQQLNPSLRLAHAIKQRCPATRVVFGGSALEEPMGDAVFARYPFLDAVFSGYGERAFPEWVEELPPRAERAIVDSGVDDLDELPIPSFDDYVQALKRHGLFARARPSVSIETSRGCWYGEKQHCTFCGFNGLQMRYKKKSAERVLDELRSLARYGLPLRSADSIMPIEFFDTLFPLLEREGMRLDAFYELKSNCSRSELETLARVGVTRLQPGIESFSTRVLTRMKKGVTGIQNVWFLRASEEIGLGCQWNILWGFPGEEPEEYAAMTALLPKLIHLQAPVGCGPLLLLRHSPNHDRAAELGFADVQPFPSYELAFGPHERLHEQAYLFDYAHADRRDPALYTRALDEQVSRWMAARRRPLAPRCELWTVFGTRWLVDTRRNDGARPRVVRLSDEEWRLLTALESPTPRSKLEGPLLERFLREGWAHEGDGRVVRLVVIRPEPSLAHEARRVAKAKAKDLWLKLRSYLPALESLQRSFPSAPSR